MSYVTAVTDRVLSDVTPTPTSKGYFNVADWTRIYGNARLTNSLAAILRAETIIFNTVTAPTTSKAPDGIITDINTLLANIERLRLAVVDQSIAGAGTEIKDDYTAGINEEAPDYIDVNLWESTVDVIWTHYGGPALVVCPTLAADLVVPTGTTAIYVDCIDADGFNIEIQGSGVLAII